MSNRRFGRSRGPSQVVFTPKAPSCWAIPNPRSKQSAHHGRLADVPAEHRPRSGAAAKRRWDPDRVGTGAGGSGGSLSPHAGPARSAADPSASSVRTGRGAAGAAGARPSTGSSNPTRTTSAGAAGRRRSAVVLGPTQAGGAGSPAAVKRSFSGARQPWTRCRGPTRTRIGAEDALRTRSACRFGSTG